MAMPAADVIMSSVGSNPVDLGASFPPCPTLSASPPPPPPTSTGPASPPPPPASIPPGFQGVLMAVSPVDAQGKFVCSYSSPFIEVAGYQFDVQNAASPSTAVTLSEAVSAFPSITAQAGPQNTVIGFSLSGATLPATSSLTEFATVTVNTAQVPAFNGLQVCVQNVVLSDSTATAVSDVILPSCFGGAVSPPPPPAEEPIVGLALTSVAATGLFSLLYTSNVAFSGYQMNVFSGATPVELASGTSASAVSFLDVSVSSNTVLAFSLTNTPVPIATTVSSLADFVVANVQQFAGVDNLCLSGN